MNYSIRFIALLGCSVISGIAYSQSTPQQNAFSDAKSFGSGLIQNGNGINNANATNIPGYNTNPPQSQLYGSSNINGAGEAAASECQSKNDPSCTAVNFSRSNPSNRPKITIPRNSPMITRGQQVQQNPAGQLGGMTGLSGSYTDCVDRPRIIPPKTEQFNCDSYANVETYNCDRILNVTVTTNNSCTPGTWFASNQIDLNWADKILVQAYCEPNSNNQYIRTYAHGSLGACGGWEYFYVDPTASYAYPQRGPRLKPHWYGNCQSVDSYYFPLGCNANVCSVRFYYSLDPDNPPFNYTTGNCPNGQYKGNEILFPADDGSYYNGSSNYCYAAEQQSYAYYGYHPATGWRYWTEYPAPIVGFSEIPNTYSMTLQYQKPFTNVLYSDQWNDQCIQYANRVQQQ